MGASFEEDPDVETNGERICDTFSTTVRKNPQLCAQYIDSSLRSDERRPEGDGVLEDSKVLLL